jgi:hypothetical protein
MGHLLWGEADTNISLVPQRAQSDCDKQPSWNKTHGQARTPAQRRSIHAYVHTSCACRWASAQDMHKFLWFPHLHRTTAFLYQTKHNGGTFETDTWTTRMRTLLMVAATLLSATRPCCPRVDGVRPLCATPSFSAAPSPQNRSAAVPHATGSLEHVRRESLLLATRPCHSARSFAAARTAPATGTCSCAKQ